MDWGVIGVGFFVNRRFATEIREDAAERIVAVHNRRLGRAQEFAEVFGDGECTCTAYDDPVALAADPRVNAVYVATPNHLHLQGVEAAARAGKPVLCEKPLAGDLEDGRRILEVVRDAGVPFLMGFAMRHLQAHRKAREIVHSGVLGKISHARFQLCKQHPVTERSWRHWADPKLGGGVVLDIGSHAVDLLAWLLSDRVASVSCETRSDLLDGSATEQTALMAIQLAGGPLASIELSFAALPARNSLEVCGHDGNIVIEGRREGRTVVTLRTEAGSETFDYPAGGGFLRQARHATRMFGEGISPDPGVEAGLENLRVLHAALESSRTGVRVQLNESGG